MKLGLLGGGTIARMVLEHAREGKLPGVEICAVCGRRPGSRAASLAAEFAVPFALDVEGLRSVSPGVVLEAASHEAVREHLVRLLADGVSVVVLSAGALADETLRASAERAAAASGALLYVPSGGIGGLDALKAACAAGVEEVTIQVAKPAAAWKGIPYVQALGVDLNRLAGAHVLFEGSAQEGVPHFPQNVNIAAVLSLAGIGFARTRLRVLADPGLQRNTHSIRVSGRTGVFNITLENVPSPDNPKTAWLACYSAIAALREIGSRARYGT